MTWSGEEIVWPPGVVIATLGSVLAHHTTPDPPKPKAYHQNTLFAKTAWLFLLTVPLPFLMFELTTLQGLGCSFFCVVPPFWGTLKAQDAIAYHLCFPSVLETHLGP